MFDIEDFQSDSIRTSIKDLGNRQAGESMREVTELSSLSRHSYVSHSGAGDASKDDSIIMMDWSNDKDLF